MIKLYFTSKKITICSDTG